MKIACMRQTDLVGCHRCSSWVPLIELSIVVFRYCRFAWTFDKLSQRWAMVVRLAMRRSWYVWWSWWLIVCCPRTNEDVSNATHFSYLAIWALAGASTVLATATAEVSSSTSGARAKDQDAWHPWFTSAASRCGLIVIQSSGVIFLLGNLGIGTFLVVSWLLRTAWFAASGARAAMMN